MKITKIKNFILLAVSLSLLLLIFYFVLPISNSLFFWPFLLSVSIIWFLFEVKMHKKDKTKIKKSLTIGILLLLATLLVNYNGLITNLYLVFPQFSLFYVYGSPIELLLIALFGGAAWFLYLPKKFNFWYSLFDILLVASLGTLTEKLLIANGILNYYNVTSFDAFFTYALVWTILHFVNYKLLNSLKLF